MHVAGFSENFYKSTAHRVEGQGVVSYMLPVKTSAAAVKFLVSKKCA